jgi:hypothetical protein
VLRREDAGVGAGRHRRDQHDDAGRSIGGRPRSFASTRAAAGIAASSSAHITRMLSFSCFTSERNRLVPSAISAAGDSACASSSMVRITVTMHQPLDAERAPSATLLKPTSDRRHRSSPLRNALSVAFQKRSWTTNPRRKTS